MVAPQLDMIGTRINLTDQVHRAIIQETEHLLAAKGNHFGHFNQHLPPLLISRRCSYDLLKRGLNTHSQVDPIEQFLYKKPFIFITGIRHASPQEKFPRWTPLAAADSILEKATILSMADTGYENKRLLVKELLDRKST